MSSRIYDDGVLVESWDDTTRTYTDHRTGQTRPYTTEENDAADQRAEQQQQVAEREARRITHDAILDATTALMDDAHTDGEPWTRPTGAHDAYPAGITVTHDGRTWTNITPANVWEPGVSGWRETIADGYPEWVQPTGGHDAYNIGDRVTFEGQNWESTINGNVWSPTAHPAGWKLLP